ncbi:MAG: glycosyltransferase family 4 protein [Anaerolineales bacterium]|nr:glycosyltransferase family 4 protein [Anaerolineales bacterium]
MKPDPKIGILHYTAPPVVGGVEAVIAAHCREFFKAGFNVTVISGRGSEYSLPLGTDLVKLPLLDSQHPRIRQINPDLENGVVPAAFKTITDELLESLHSILADFDFLIVHNVFTKHFNLPLTAALTKLVEQKTIRSCTAWCHDFTWTSENSREKVHPGYPWDLLRTKLKDVTYVTVSRDRQHDLAGLFGISTDEIHVVYNGVDPEELLGLSAEGLGLVKRIRYLDESLNLLMPVRITQAKNLEFAFRVSAALKDMGCPNKLIITGPPDPHSVTNMLYFQSLKDMRIELGLEDSIFFVYEQGTESGEPYTVSMQVIGDLYRTSDALLMPSHREGFGMPVLEAGLVGLPVFCSEIPAAQELGMEDMYWLNPEARPEEAAQVILSWAEQDKTSRMRRRTRQNYTWRAIFKQNILPLLEQDPRD